MISPLIAHKKVPFFKYAQMGKSEKMNALDLLVLALVCGAIYDWWYFKSKHLKSIYALRRHARTAGMIAFAVVMYLSMRASPSHAERSVISLFGMLSKTQLPWSREGMREFDPILRMTNLPVSSSSPSSASASRKPTKRAVSETKKKYVAAQQGWTCAHCRQTLTHTYEIDHVHALEHGGSNDASNLVALCRECHGQKTAREHM